VPLQKKAVFGRVVAFLLWPSSGLAPAFQWLDVSKMALYEPDWPLCGVKNRTLQFFLLYESFIDNTSSATKTDVSPECFR